MSRNYDHRPHGFSKRMLAVVLALAALMCTAGCWRIGAERNVVRSGIAFAAFREYDDGTKLGILAGDRVIDGWPCKRDFIVFHPDWRLAELQLSRDYERNGVSMPAGTWVFPNEQGNPGTCMFPHDVEIQGYRCRGSWAGKEGFMTVFYPSGRLKLFFSRDPVAVDGVVCDDSLFQGIALYESGRLQQCKLAEKTRIGGVEYPAGAIVRFDEAGKVLAGDR
jgi:hypothetical protein